jgi:hypothetical protein
MAMNATDYVGRQVRWYEEQSEAWLRDLRDADQCAAIEEVIAFGNYLYARIRHIDAEWSAEMDSLGAVPDEADAEAMWALYANWCKKTESNLRVAAEIAKKGYEVEGLADYQRGFQEAKLITSISIDRFRMSLRHQAEGRTRPLGELRDELQRRADARS